MGTLESQEGLKRIGDCDIVIRSKLESQEGLKREVEVAPAGVVGRRAELESQEGLKRILYPCVFM